MTVNPAGGSYVVLVAPPISLKPVEQSVVLLCHWYVNTPSPVDATDSVKAAGSPPEHIV